MGCNCGKSLNRKSSRMPMKKNKNRMTPNQRRASVIKIQNRRVSQNQELWERHLKQKNNKD